MIDRAAHLDALRASDHLVDGAEAELGHVLTHFLGNEAHEIDDVLRIAGELLAQLGILRGDADRAGIQMARAHHDAAQRLQRPGGESKFFRAKQGADDDVAAGLQLPVDLDADAAAQVVENKHLVRFGEPELPRNSSVLDGRQRRRAGAAIVSGDQNDVAESDIRDLRDCLDRSGEWLTERGLREREILRNFVCLIFAHHRILGESPVDPVPHSPPLGTEHEVTGATENTTTADDRRGREHCHRIPQRDMAHILTDFDHMP